jgi:hypothetical protein
LNEQGIIPQELEAVEVTSSKPKEVEPEFVDVVGHISLRSLEKSDKKRHQQKQQQRPPMKPQQRQQGSQQQKQQGPQQQKPQGPSNKIPSNRKGQLKTAAEKKIII